MVGNAWQKALELRISTLAGNNDHWHLNWVNSYDLRSSKMED